jgi:hypothetical protein
MAAPDGGNAVGQRQFAVGVLTQRRPPRSRCPRRRHQAAAKAMATSAKLQPRVGRASAIQATLSRCADRWAACPAASDTNSASHSAKVTEFRNHGLGACVARPCPGPAFWTARSQRVGGFGRHVVFVVFGQHFARRNMPSPSSLPWATTPLPSLKRSGRMPDSDGDRTLAVSVTHEVDGHAVSLAFDAAGLDQPAQAEGAVRRRLALATHLSGLNRRRPGCSGRRSAPVRPQRPGRTSTPRNGQAQMTWFHRAIASPSPRSCVSLGLRLPCALMNGARRRAWIHQTSMTKPAAVTPMLPHTYRP